MFPTNNNIKNEILFNTINPALINYNFFGTQINKNIPTVNSNSSLSQNNIYNPSFDPMITNKNTYQGFNNNIKSLIDINRNFNMKSNSIRNLNHIQTYSKIIKLSNFTKKNKRSFNGESYLNKFKVIYGSYSNLDIFNFNINKMLFNFYKSIKEDCSLKDFFSNFIKTSIFGMEVFYFYEGKSKVIFLYNKFKL
jgi:hypothetical protein